MGEDGQLYAVLLGWAALLSWHSIVSGWWSSRQQRCKDACGGTESCGEDCIRLCVLCTQSALGRTGFRRHRRRDRRALLSMWETRTSEGTGGPEQNISKTGKYVGSGEVCHTEVGQPKGSAASTLQFITWTLQLFVAELSVGSAPVLFIGRGRHGRIRHQPDLTWVCWWRQVTEEEVHLCRAVAAGHYFFFFRRCGGRQHRGEGAGGWHSAVNFRDDARRRDVLLGYAPHALPITCSRRAAVEGREGPGRLR